jgi:hypothetical protein
MKMAQNQSVLIILLVVGIALSLAVALPSPVYADFGPKPSITIVVKNPPAEEYYLDLLINENQGNGRSNLNDELNSLDPAKLKLLEEYHVDGWTPALVQGTSAPLFGKLTGNRQGKDMVHTFSYFGTPDRFKIIIITPDNRMLVSPEIMRDTFQMTITYDYQTATFTNRSIFVAYLLQIVSTLLPTLLIEGLLLLLFGFSLRKNLWPFLLVNLATQVLLTAALGTAGITQGMFAAYLLALPAELVVIIIESIAFALLLKQHGKGRRIAYAITANLVSLIASLVAMTVLFA